ncbi:endonuclease V [Blastopirellula marina]|uniref:Methylated-DNA-[protein]-cysteine S-methyltransferase DNA binding domain-containing protein n=1 Tax=Blastopirellula marina TaxID=124 RepID=A0A2S8GC84_9BACT|nr:endonuclease V [Blastopirellula marina]PQO41694.1 hypothetical protein C5Y98_02940 [Blastopirellula marina]PTL46137.1 hypothetical protein C5Y97_02940 [Blastopirellula marina]
MPLPDLRHVADSLQQRIPDLFAELKRLVLTIPPGHVVTYGDLAKELGDSGASRWVASYLLLPEGPLADCSHRVVRSTGELGLYHNQNVDQKAQKLASEGVSVQNNQVDLKRFRWTLPAGSKPLVALKAWQRDFACPVGIELAAGEVQTIGGLDVSYQGDMAVAVCSCFGADGKELQKHFAHTMRVRFPYISGYLAFREIPVYLELFAEMQANDCLPDVLLVDGNGRLHPRRMGIATMLGALIGIPTIGIAKNQLCGSILSDQLTVGSWEPIVASKNEPDDVLGYAILPHAKTKNPLYVSQGLGIGDLRMQEIVARCFAGHRSPEPIYHADRESRRIASTL